MRSARADSTVSAISAAGTISRKRVLPAQAGKPGEVTVQRAESEAVLNGEGGQMGIGDEVSFVGLLLQERTEHLAMAFCWLGNPDGRAIQPLFHLAPSPGNACRARKDTRVGNQTDKGQQAGPGQTHRRGAGEPAVRPRRRRLAQWEAGAVSIN